MLENDESFFPPSFADELKGIQRQMDAQAPKKKPKPEPAPAIESDSQDNLPVSDTSDMFTDMRLAELFAQMFRGVIRYWPETGKWLVFDDRRWTTDTPGGAYPFVRKMINELYSRAQACADYGQRAAMLKAILKLEEHPRQKTILEAAKVRPELIVSASELDQHHMLLTVNNGTIDLKTGKLAVSRVDDLLTRMTHISYNPSAECPKFIAFLLQIFGGEMEIIDYLQRYFGYCLTGRTDEQMLLFFYGMGCNGKSVLANILDALLGDYSRTSGSDLLMSRDNRSSTNDVAALRGSRLVKVSEFDDSERLAEAQIKTLTGGDPVTCRFLHHEFFSYVPTYKILLIGNHKPKTRNNDHGLWRRLFLLKFGVTIPEGERNPHLQEELLKELPGILAWAVEGCLEWQKLRGLRAPQIIKAATEEYRRSEDVFQLWIDECCFTGSQHVTPAAELMGSFIDHSRQTKISSKKFGDMLSGAGFIREPTGGLSWWRGLGLQRSAKKPDYHHESDDNRPF